ncbi:hypothetical protein COO91_03639 [Nostoc flagelliforme CCNUN1]|uniref:Uncharacterized protein n=1 Tax=Nostoc flagelliforme CCNUN1 TaxID=2038116 RepID=A0A2K8SQW0_9NOSO|nr:hypothetical protein COO91_03639 [Nostoc flagelliforme CCNUN1]
MSKLIFRKQQKLYAQATQRSIEIPLMGLVKVPEVKLVKLS